MATIINNLPKGNVKAPLGAIMKINTGELLHDANFDNNTEFVLEFTPDNLDQNGNPIYVRSGITEDKVVIGNNQLGIKIPYNTSPIAINDQTYLYTVEDDKDFYNFFITTIRDSISILDEKGNSYRWYDEENSKGLRLTNLSDENYRESGVVPGEIFYLKNNLSFGSMNSTVFESDYIYLSGTGSDVKFTTLLINSHNSSSTALEFSLGLINIINNNDFKYPLNKFVYLDKSVNKPSIKLFFYNNLLFMTDTGVTGSGLEETHNFLNIDSNFINYLSTTLSQGSKRFNAIGYGETFLEITDSTALRYNSDSLNKPKTNTLLFFPAINN